LSGRARFHLAVLVGFARMLLAICVGLDAELGLDGFRH